ncbi:MAG: hypothetical protein ACHBN1_18215 [Heteroscytonema crispum UTEX LB 1556]
MGDKGDKEDGCGRVNNFSSPMPKGRQMPGSGNPPAALAQQCPMPYSPFPISKKSTNSLRII